MGFASALAASAPETAKPKAAAKVVAPSAKRKAAVDQRTATWQTELEELEKLKGRMREMEELRARLNLMRNACEAMPKGGELKVRTRLGPPRDGQVGRHIEIQVSDTGEGIRADVGKKLFQPFLTTKTGGTGLGLAIVHKVAELHGGEILWNSAPGRGATFTLRIPLRVPEAPEDRTADDGTAGDRGRKTDRPRSPAQRGNHGD